MRQLSTNKRPYKQSSRFADRLTAGRNRPPAAPDERRALRRRFHISVVGFSVLVAASPWTLAQDKKSTPKESPSSTVKHRNARPALSGDGSVVVFQSTSQNIVPGDATGTRHIYAFERETKKITRVSVDDSGKPGNKQSFGASISADGRFVVFTSDANNLVPGDTAGNQDVFLRDREAGTVIRISVSSTGEQANRDCRDAVISANGRIIAFTSSASNLDENNMNNSADIFVYDRVSKFMRRITMTPDGFEADHGSGEPSISSDGRYVAFYSHATNLLPIDTNRSPDIYVFDLFTGTTELVSVASNRMIGNRDSRRPSISGDGMVVVFESWASNLTADDKNDVPDIILRDRQSKRTICISNAPDGKPGNDDSRDPRISDDGNIIIYTSYASNLVKNDTNNLADVFVYNRKTRKTERVNLSGKNEQAGSRSGEGTLSANGEIVAFTSKASNLIEGDTNRSLDIFLVDRPAKKVSRISDPKNKKKSP